MYPTINSAKGGGSVGTPVCGIKLQLIYGTILAPQSLLPTSLDWHTDREYNGRKHTAVLVRKQGRILAQNGGTSNCKLTQQQQAFHRHQVDDKTRTYYQTYVKCLFGVRSSEADSATGCLMRY